MTEALKLAQERHRIALQWAELYSQPGHSESDRFIALSYLDLHERMQKIAEEVGAADTKAWLNLPSDAVFLRILALTKGTQ